ncbi:MAG: hypothetical protein IT393_00490 [Nitrospirae bacterium]|nr:hypothetical protein [Nitrospirota bacterium]
MSNDKHGRNFIPVAEEYIRKGMLDQAIELLKEGIGLYPGYLSARVSLGKAYMEKGMFNEAMGEFEHVVRMSPDNLLAHRKLAFLYRDAGMLDSSIRSCEAVLIYSPGDREISDLLRMLRAERMEKIRRSSDSDERKAPASVERSAAAIDFTSGWEVSADESRPGGISEEYLTESMGDICIAQGEKAKGIEIFRKILEKDPSNESIKNKLIELGEISPPHTAGIERLQDLLNNVRTNRR